MMDLLVTPGKMVPLFRGGVTSSSEPSARLSKMKRFMAPTSVISWSSPNNQRHCWQPCSSAIF